MIARSFRNARILIVDDENDNVEILRRVLTKAGFVHIESTTDSRQASRSSSSTSRTSCCWICGCRIWTGST